MIKNFYIFSSFLFLATTSTLNEYEGEVNDNSVVLPGFCQSLEAVLRQGLKGRLHFI